MKKNKLVMLHSLPLMKIIINMIYIYIYIYIYKLRNRYETLQERTEKYTPNDEYGNFINAHLEAAAKCIPTKLRTKYRVPWETLAVRKKRALVKTAFQKLSKKPNKHKCLKTKNGTISIRRHIYKGTDRIHSKSDRED